MRLVILIEEVFNELAHVLNDEVNLSAGDVVRGCENNVVAAHTISGTGTRIDVDAVRASESYWYVRRSNTEHESSICLC